MTTSDAVSMETRQRAKALEGLRAEWWMNYFFDLYFFRLYVSELYVMLMRAGLEWKLFAHYYYGETDPKYRLATDDLNKTTDMQNFLNVLHAHSSRNIFSSITLSFDTVLLFALLLNGQFVKSFYIKSKFLEI